MSSNTFMSMFLVACLMAWPQMEGHAAEISMELAGFLAITNCAH
jgi:hypothetical protein